MYDKRFIITLKQSEHKKFKLLAIEQGKTMTFLARQAIREFMIKHIDNKEK